MCQYSLKFLSNKSPDLFIITIYYWWLNGKESTCNAEDARNTLPWRRRWKPAPVFLPGKFHGQRSLVVYSPWGHKESDTTDCMSTHTDTRFTVKERIISFPLILALPNDSDSKESACNAGDQNSIPGSGRYPGERNGNPLQYSSLKIPWTEEPGGLQSTGSQRVGHDWATHTFTSLSLLACIHGSAFNSQILTLK